MEQFPRHYKIHKIIIFGDKYPSSIIQKLDNPFWNDVVKSCITLYNRIKKENNNSYNIPLWFNNDININYKKDWFYRGYTSLRDILDNNGNLFTHRDMENRGLSINFLDYEKLRYDIHKLSSITKDCEMFGPYLPYILFTIGYNIKGCAKIYNLLMNCNNNVVRDIQNKWEGSLNEEIPYHMVEKLFTQIQNMKEGSFMKYLQFRILHRRIVTNV